MKRDQIKAIFEKHLSKHPLYKSHHRIDVHDLGKGDWSISYRTTDSNTPHLENETHISINIQKGIFYLLWINLEKQHRGECHGAAYYKMMEEIAEECGCPQIRQTPSGQTPTKETRESYLLRRGWIKDGVEVYKEF